MIVSINSIDCKKHSIRVTKGNTECDGENPSNQLGLSVLHINTRLTDFGIEEAIKTRRTVGMDAKCF